MEARTFRVGDRVVAYLSVVIDGYRWYTPEFGEVCPFGTDLYLIRSPSIPSRTYFLNYLLKDSCVRVPEIGNVLTLRLVAMDELGINRIWKLVHSE